MNMQENAMDNLSMLQHPHEDVEHDTFTNDSRFSLFDRISLIDQG